MSECPHGHLARSCEICERDQRIAELEGRLDKKDKQIALINEYATSRLCGDHQGKWSRGRCISCELERAESRFDQCESELRAARMTFGAVIANNGGELYLANSTLESIDQNDAIERRDSNTNGVFFKLNRAVEKLEKNS